jgi:hypothetical protein
MWEGLARLRSAALVVAALAAPAWSSAAVPASLKSACVRHDAADDNLANGAQAPFWRCDDGVPAAGGRTPNPGAARAIAVPQSYGGDGFSGLPPRAPAQPGTGADQNGDIALDANVSLPDPARFPPPRRGYPLVVFMHGCCGGDRKAWEAKTIDARAEQWHYSNAWFAARGYAVLSYTARGFVDGQGRGSTGESRLDSRRYEINDFQQLSGELADTSFTLAGRGATIDPARVVVTAGSYGGGFAWLALTDPTWRSPGGKAMRLAAVAPKYGWTDLVEALVPNGGDPRDGLRSFDPASRSAPLGFPKRTIVAGLYAAGKTGVPPGTPHTTFPAALDRAILCLESQLPLATSPLCATTVRDELPLLIRDSSAYFQNEFFDRIRADRSARVPVYSAGTFTDPLFPPPEHRRMAERLKATVPGYPIQEYYGDYQHFVQNKEKEWVDLCGPSARPCSRKDYPGGDLSAAPDGLRRLGATTRLNRFLDHYAKPQANPAAPPPARDVTASLQVCPANASAAFPLDQPGERFTAPRFDDLAPDRLRLRATGAQATLNKALPNLHALAADPLLNQLTNGNRCPRAEGPAGVGVATYEFAPLARDVVMIGRTRLTIPHTGVGGELQLNARLYEVRPDGTATMVDRGGRAVGSPSATTTLDLHGNGWRFGKGSRIRVEIAQDDDLYLRFSSTPSALTLAGVTLDMPIREAGPSSIVRAPRLASDAGRSARFAFLAEPATEEFAGATKAELQVRDRRSRRWRPLEAPLGRCSHSFRGRGGHTYSLRYRVFGRGGEVGAWSPTGTTVVPTDDRALRRRGFRRVRSASAYGRTLSRGRQGARVRLRFRGDRVYLVGRRSPRAGVARVTVNGRRRRVSFRGSSKARAVLATFKVARRGRSSLRFVVLRGRVDLDAIGVRAR